MSGPHREIVLVTGGSGFLGQHIVMQLQKDVTVKEIRVLDKVPYKNIMGHLETKPIKMFLCDLCDGELCREAIAGVDVVLHCAALVSYDFPPDKEALQRNNVLATQNLIDLCVEEGVGRLINCGTTEVTLSSYIRGGVVALVAYSNESKLKVPENKNRLIFGEYAISKLKAEELVLEANGTPLLKKAGVLRTVSLRSPFLYGENDDKFISRILQIARKHGNSLVKPAGVGGKQQLTYVGNAAWAFICAKDAIRDKPDGIAGLPVIITDDTLVEDLLRFCERITRNTDHHISFSWSIPMPISYLLALVTELKIRCYGLLAGIHEKIPVSPTSALAYLGSVILYSRARASIHMNYSPIYSAKESLENASAYYCKGTYNSAGVNKTKEQ